MAPANGLILKTIPRKSPLRQFHFAVWSRVACLLFAALFLASPALTSAQDDVTTQNGSSAVDGGWITGPASNPLSFLNGPANRTFGNAAPYDFPDFHPAASLDARLPHWIAFEAEERFRFEYYRNASLQTANDDSYMLNRFRFQADLRATSWIRFSTQVQDARPLYQKPPIGPPNENRWDLKLAYAEFGNPEKHWISLRVGRQLINYNNTILANSEWRDQGRSYDAAVMNLQSGRYHAGIFAASAVVPLASGISHHQEGNNIYGIYGRIDSVLPNSSLEPFVLWRVQQSVVVQPALSSAKGKQSVQAYGLRMKGAAGAAVDYSLEAVVESGRAGNDPIRAWAGTGGIAYQKNSLLWRPRVFTQYDYASGDGDPSQAVHHTFDTIYPTAHDRFGILDLFGWQNIQAVRGGGTVIPRLRWTVTAQYLDLRVAQAGDVAYNSSGSSLGYGSGKAGTRLGGETDVYSWYELDRHFNIGAGYGRLGAGSYLSQINLAHAYSSFYVALNFKDNGKLAAGER